MFTGIVQELARVARRDARGGGVQRVRFEPVEMDCNDLVIGESISIDGCCLTVVSFDATGFEIEATPETLERTTLGERGPGSQVNLERAMRMGDRIGGHLVTGHIDGVGRLQQLNPTGDAVEADFTVPAALMPFFVEKGSVAVDGVSLTVNTVGEGTFSIYLIPHTLSVTTLGQRQPGDRVNIETDLLGKYVVRMLEARGFDAGTGGITTEFLKEHGFD